eukprot:TRINITY_DN267_c0_g1_i1.p1 TRINITY_DN267_c0_g1~~TRINITY_DN267_c0_g1_i1.p1  ORF type:complete len:471 (+),score=99.91 TRINITY_DN267_c0_g1_i1:97-1509(+)
MNSKVDEIFIECLNNSEFPLIATEIYNILEINEEEFKMNLMNVNYDEHKIYSLFNEININENNYKLYCLVFFKYYPIKHDHQYLLLTLLHKLCNYTIKTMNVCLIKYIGYLFSEKSFQTFLFDAKTLPVGEHRDKFICLLKQIRACTETLGCKVLGPDNIPLKNEVGPYANSLIQLVEDMFHSLPPPVDVLVEDQLPGNFVERQRILEDEEDLNEDLLDFIDDTSENVDFDTSLFIEPILVNNDNYNYLIVNNLTKKSVLVDCSGNGEEIISFCKKHGYIIEAVFLTHMHQDHFSGLPRLREYFKNVFVYEPSMLHSLSVNRRNAELPILDDLISVNISTFHAHSDIDVILYIPEFDSIFTGDILFPGVCGKVFTGDFAGMFECFQYLKKFAEGETIFYPGHEYLLNCIPFLHSIDQHEFYVKRLNDNEYNEFPSLYITLKEELGHNLFFNAKNVDELRKIRLKKDSFVG